MVNNIMILGINRKVSRQVSEMLAEQLQMHFLDIIELFEFDNIPRSLSDVLGLKGERYYREKEVGLNKYVSSFENTVIHGESGAVLKSKNIKNVKNNCLVVYIHFPAAQVKKFLSVQDYKTKQLKKFFNVSLDRIKRRVELLKKNADISITGTGKSSFKITSEILRAMDSYFLK